MKRWIFSLATAAMTSLGALPTLALEVVFQPVADGVYAYIGDTRAGPMTTKA